MGVNGSIGLPGPPGMQVDMVVLLCAIIVVFVLGSYWRAW